ncbi:environmental stress-induced protein Ves [Allocatelliglobosispora scoriae]|uniref:Environmental stress-induced protein Ves n=1 Tax=Allocatelliglobosispora scoriae TaxID=643052 RepID=A0A841BMX3_9ACTN|nr:HutD family protein [Allocatelliglobosispora scoriae]MBB5868170.1 environmental stress-induced protein Ves [Allocatelliglobosispora scoriae]
MTLTRLPAAGRAAQPWRNGGGLTREIAAEPGRWRLSLAEIERAGPFSAFPNRRRVLTVVRGAGISLVVDGAATTVGPLAPFAFSGDADVSCGLVDGPVTALNAITAGSASVSVRKPAASVELPAAGLLAIVVIQGIIRVRGQALSQWDALLARDEGPVLAETVGVGAPVLVAVELS